MCTIHPHFIYKEKFGIFWMHKDSIIPLYDVSSFRVSYWLGCANRENLKLDIQTNCFTIDREFTFHWPSTKIVQAHLQFLANGELQGLGLVYTNISIYTHNHTNHKYSFILPTHTYMKHSFIGMCKHSYSHLFTHIRTNYIYS